MSAFILAAFWAAVPQIPAGFLLPKIAVILFGMLVTTLWDNKRGLLLLGVMCLSTLHSVNVEDSAVGAPGAWTYGIVPVVVYLLLMRMPTEKPWLRWAAIGLSVHALIQMSGLEPPPQGRAVAWIGSPIDLGALLAMAAPVSGAWLPLVLAGIWATGSRGALLAVAFAFGSNKVRILLLPLLFLPFFLSQPKDIARQEMARIAWRGFLEKPWLGHGPATYRHTLQRLRTERLDAAARPSYKQQHAHNDILDMLCSTGLLGLTAYLLLLWPLRRNQSLVALFVVMKFNPLGFEVLCAAALIAANELRKRNAPAGLQTLGGDSLVSNPSLPYPPGQALARSLL